LPAKTVLHADEIGCECSIVYPPAKILSF
jgi:hypothetical protein